MISLVVAIQDPRKGSGEKEYAGTNSAAHGRNSGAFSFALLRGMSLPRSALGEVTSAGDT